MKFIENIQKACAAVASFLSTHAQALKTLFSYGYSFFGRKEPKAPAATHAGRDQDTPTVQKVASKDILFSNKNSRRQDARQQKKRRRR